MHVFTKDVLLLWPYPIKNKLEIHSISEDENRVSLPERSITALSLVLYQYCDSTNISYFVVQLSFYANHIFYNFKLND